MEQENKERIAQELGDRLKVLEKEYEGERLPRHQPFVVRLDGHKFSKFTKKFRKPYDSFFAEMMLKTSEDLLNEFNPRTVYTASDEITMVFHGIPEDAQGSTHIYDGRRQKICSLMAGFASTRFNQHMLQHSVTTYLLTTNKRSDMFYKQVRELLGVAYFDARVFSVTNDIEAMESILWRQRDDTFRNGVNAIAQATFSSRALHGKKLGEVMEMLRQKNILINEYPSHLLYGTMFKKKLVTVIGKNPKTGETCPVVRGRVHSESVSLSKMADAVGFVMSKYWE